MPDATWDQSAVDLNNKVGGLIAQGDAWQTDTSLSGGSPPSWTSAVYAYQQAGVAGATDVGPEIDSAGRPNITQKYTQAAWTLNAALAAVNSTTSTQEDARLAEEYAKRMYSEYQTAIAMGKSGLKSPDEMWKTGLLLGGVGALWYWWYASGKTIRRLRGR